MLKTIGLALICCGCVTPRQQLHRVPPRLAQTIPVVDSLTAVERARIIEAVVRFRRMILIDDTMTRIDGCSVAKTVGPDYLTLLVPEVRPLVVESPSGCGTSLSTTVAMPRLIRITRIQGSGNDAVAQLTYLAERTYTHEEEFKIRRASRRPDGLWAATEMRVYNALIID